MRRNVLSMMTEVLINERNEDENENNVAKAIAKWKEEEEEKREENNNQI